MAELVYAHDLKSCLVRDVGSIPTSGTQLNNAPLAQLVEQIPLKDKVEGSIPSGRTKCKGTLCEPEADEPRRGRAKIQQNFMCDHKFKICRDGGIGIRASLRN